jgi:hypothetical protein
MFSGCSNARVFSPSMARSAVWMAAPANKGSPAAAVASNIEVIRQAAAISWTEIARNAGVDGYYRMLLDGFHEILGDVRCGRAAGFYRRKPILSTRPSPRSEPTTTIHARKHRNTHIQKKQVNLCLRRHGSTHILQRNTLGYRCTWAAQII